VSLRAGLARVGYELGIVVDWRAALACDLHSS
jgi:hypothetical protein